MNSPCSCNPHSLHAAKSPLPLLPSFQSLRDYYETRGVSTGASEDHVTDALGELLSDDDSFDDLRDS